MLSPFGTKRDFWFKYDTFAAKFDKDMLARLITDLNVLLIFGRPPFDKPAPSSQAYRSLLATVSAVLEKQWLQTYEPTGQTGAMEQQAIKGTEKFVGAEKWGLQPVMETLAALLLVSLALFLAVLVLVNYLWTINETVVIIVLAFAAAGGLLYVLMVVFAAIFSTCPFQTGSSHHGSYQGFLNLKSPSVIVVIRSGLALALFPALYIIFYPFLAFIFAVVILIAILMMLRIPLLYLIPYDDNLGINSLHAHSAILMTKSASNAEMLIIADNTPLISDIEAVRPTGTSTALQHCHLVFKNQS
ncbi:hypothetical protein FRB94_010021 [Tulasnella sp. JGI-2019a]|nr:hypothetical protein FRB94_010021 [Tulasnella sp. JGI-2019a]